MKVLIQTWQVWIVYTNAGVNLASVTYQRKRLLISAEAREILRIAWLDVKQRFPFTTDAICLLPEHIHCIWTLPMGDTNYSIRWKEIKRLFSRQYNRQIGNLPAGNSSRKKREEVTLWQRRFWEHTIRDETDYQNHLNYIHYNPVKHELVKQVNLWQWLGQTHQFCQHGKISCFAATSPPVYLG